MRRPVGIPDKCRLRSRQFPQPGIVARIIDGFFGIESRPALPRPIVIFDVRIIVADKERPAKESRFPGLVDLIISPRPARCETIVVCIRPDLTPVQVTGLLIDRNAIRVPVTHNINLRPRLCLTWREQVTRRDLIAAVRLDANANDLAPQIIAVTRGSARVVLHMTRKIVQWRVTVAFVLRALLVKWRRIIPRREIQQLVRAESNATTGMTTDLPLRLHLQDRLFRGLVDRIVDEGEA